MHINGNYYPDESIMEGIEEGILKGAIDTLPTGSYLGVYTDVENTLMIALKQAKRHRLDAAIYNSKAALEKLEEKRKQIGDD